MGSITGCSDGGSARPAVERLLQLLRVRVLQPALAPHVQRTATTMTSEIEVGVVHDRSAPQGLLARGLRDLDSRPTGGLAAPAERGPDAQPPSSRA